MIWVELGFRGAWAQAQRAAANSLVADGRAFNCESAVWGLPRPTSTKEDRTRFQKFEGQSRSTPGSRGTQLPPKGPRRDTESESTIRIAFSIPLETGPGKPRRRANGKRVSLGTRCSMNFRPAKISPKQIV